MPKAHFAFVRALQTSGGANIKTFDQIKSAEAHAKRLDLTSQNRQDEGRSHAANYFWSKAGEGLSGGGADYTAAYHEHKGSVANLLSRCHFWVSLMRRSCYERLQRASL